MMAGRTPKISDKDRRRRHAGSLITTRGEAARGRANFITGEAPIRTGKTTVGQAGATHSIPAQAVNHRYAALKGMGYATGQFAKNHLCEQKRISARRARLRRILATCITSTRGDPGILLIRGAAETPSVRAIWSILMRPCR